MGWTNRAVRGITVPGTAGPADPRVFVGQGDPALAAISQPAGIVLYWGEDEAWVISVEDSGPDRGQLHIYAYKGGVIRAQIIDVDYDEVTATAVIGIAGANTSATIGPVTLRSTVDWGGSTSEDAYLTTVVSTPSAVYVTTATTLQQQFVAPPSGKGWVCWSSACDNNTAAADSYAAPQLTAITPGAAGTFAANDNMSIRSQGTTDAEFGKQRLMTGLTPGATYQLTLMHRAGAGTASFARRAIGFQPAL